MDYQVSARKYRPGTFHEVIGQPHVVQTLVNAITTRRIAHAFLFSGTRGVGKTTVARILAKALNCERGPTGTPCETCPNCVEITQGTSVDVIEIDGASNTGVDDVREIRENVKFTPFRGGYRVYIIDEVHMLSNSAFNALLKTLEEPPAHVVFIFATTEIHKIPATILSRCQHFNFRRISTSEIISRLRHVAEHDGILVEDRSLAIIARASEGSMRDSLSLLDQAVAFGGKTVRHGDLESLLGSVPQEQVRTLIAAIIAHDSPAALRVIAQLLECGHDLRAYCSEVVEYVRNLLVASVVPTPKAPQGLQDLCGLIDLAEEDLRQVVTDARAFTADQLQDLFRIFSQAEDGIRLSPHPRFILEAAAVRATRLLRVPAMTTAAAPQHMTEPSPGSDRSRVGISSKAPAGVDTASPTPALASMEATRPTASPTAATRPSPETSSRLAVPPRTPSGTTQAEPPTSASSASTMRPPVRTAQDAVTGRQSHVALAWEQVVGQVERRHPNIAPFLAAGTLLGIEGNRISIGYPKTASIALTRIQKEETRRLVTDICTELAGQLVSVHVLELPDGEPAPPSLAQLRAAKKQSEKDSLLAQARSHPLVKHTLEIFGGDLIEVRPTSPQEETR